MAAVNYTLTVSQDKYSILNNEALSINYLHTKVDKCTADTIIASGLILTTATYEVPFLIDGIYNINLTSITPGDESDIVIKYYVNLQLSMIEDIFSVLCSCEGCTTPSITGPEAILTTRTKIDTFLTLSSPIYDPYLLAVRTEIECLVAPPVYCGVYTEGLSGQTVYNEKLALQLIALDYLTMYFTDSLGITDVDDIAYIDTKYQSEAILCCINTLGLDIAGIKTLVEAV